MENKIQQILDEVAKKKGFRNYQSLLSFNKCVKGVSETEDFVHKAMQEYGRQCYNEALDLAAERAASVDKQSILNLKK